MIRRSDFKQEIFTNLRGRDEIMFARDVTPASGDFFEVHHRDGSAAVVFAKQKELEDNSHLTALRPIVLKTYYIGDAPPSISAKQATKHVQIGLVLWHDIRTNSINQLTQGAIVHGTFYFEPVKTAYPRLFVNETTKMFNKHWVRLPELKYYTDIFDTVLIPDDLRPDKELTPREPSKDFLSLVDDLIEDEDKVPDTHPNSPKNRIKDFQQGMW